MALKSRGYEKLTISNTAVGVAVPNAAAPGYALIRIADARVMFRDDGTNPTATDGMPLFPDDVLFFDGPLQSLKFIRRDSTDATAHITYYGNFAP